MKTAIGAFAADAVTRKITKKVGTVPGLPLAIASTLKVFSE